MYVSDMLGHIENALGIDTPADTTLVQRETAVILSIESLKSNLAKCFERDDKAEIARLRRMVKTAVKQGMDGATQAYQEQFERMTLELTVARTDVAEYRSLVDRCRERNKELGVENTELRDRLCEFDVDYCEDRTDRE